MKGALWKWTNYWNGWQMRWFVLENGVLAYYKSEEDVNSGCKGSVKVSTCEIDLPHNDPTRITISIPGEQHMYLRAPTHQDRQKWIVALGTAKACVTTKNPEVANGVDSLKIKRAELGLYCDLLMQQVRQVKEIVEKVPPDTQKLFEATSDLPLTCDTFTQTLDEIIKQVDASLRQDLPHAHAFDTGIPIHTRTRSMKLSSSFESTERKT